MYNVQPNFHSGNTALNKNYPQPLQSFLNVNTGEQIPHTGYSNNQQHIFNAGRSGTQDPINNRVSYVRSPQSTHSQTSTPQPSLLSSHSDGSLDFETGTSSWN